MNRSSRCQIIFVFFIFLAVIGTVTQVVAVPVASPGNSGTQQGASPFTIPPHATTRFNKYPDLEGIEGNGMYLLSLINIYNLMKLSDKEREEFFTENTDQRVKVIKENEKFAIQHKDFLTNVMIYKHTKPNRPLSTDDGDGDLDWELHIELLELQARLDRLHLSYEMEYHYQSGTQRTEQPPGSSLH
ncbi:hypothetical protein EV361DRAFT_947875 [Lentinula raphanica]|uniref:Uncharacterized protein n=1 Tax=Lentinula raphanica TaxID=153919 RepID=A0AA38ULC4_9AGAR|nr:hypothetical protein F5878DRAFT_654967 [Lentinula raphanica]KAJ3973473.1 hypothetical protein EV361DRAFT_947875 [Lentinula raphanica]